MKQSQVVGICILSGDCGRKIVYVDVKLGIDCGRKLKKDIRNLNLNQQNFNQTLGNGVTNLNTVRLTTKQFMGLLLQQCFSK